MSAPEDVLKNGLLRNQIVSCLTESGEGAPDEPFIICRYAMWNIDKENDYLCDVLEWERAPIKTLREQLGSRYLTLLPCASDFEVTFALNTLIRDLYCINQSLIFADHLSDRRLYEILVNGVLPCNMKQLPDSHSLTYWNFCYYTETGVNETSDEVWLTYYASDEQRRRAAFEGFGVLPPKLDPPYRREYYPRERFPEFFH